VVRVVEVGRGLGFILEALQLARVEGGGERQNLDGNVPGQRHLFGLVNHAHAAAAHLAQDAVIAQAGRLIVRTRAYVDPRPGRPLQVAQRLQGREEPA
jgi:hypothetical protein